MAEITPLAALEQKLVALRTLDLIRRNPSAHPELIGESPRPYETLDIFMQELTALHLAVPVAWTADCFDLVRQASLSLSLEAWPPEPSEDALPRAALHCLPAPLLNLQFGEDRQEPVNALLVGFGMDSMGEHKLVVRGYAMYPRFAAPVINYTIGLGKDFESTIDPTMRNDPTFRDELRTLLRWIFAAWAFIDQRLLQVVKSPSLERHARKRAIAAGIDPAVHVVTLRRLAPTTVGTEQEQREWTCRWLVRGHWRKQWHPREGRHVPTWIFPHIKGPADKPLRTPAPEVWRVAR